MATRVSKKLFTFTGVSKRLLTVTRVA